MNVRESNDVNILLRWLLRAPRAGGDQVTDEEARETAGRLADAAYKRLMAGLDSAQVRKRFVSRVKSGR